MLVTLIMACMIYHTNRLNIIEHTDGRVKSLVLRTWPNITIMCRVLIKYLIIRGHLLFFYNKSIHSSFLRLS